MAAAPELPESIVKQIRNSFNKFDIDKNGHITSAEIGNVMKALGEDIPGFKLRQIINEVDRDKNGTVEFNEFLQIFASTTGQATAHGFKAVIQKVDNIQVASSTTEANDQGTKHSSSDAEYRSFTNWINTSLKNDGSLAKYLPIDNTLGKNELFERCKDGIILCKLINLSASKTVDERAINTTKLTAFTMQENQTLVINSARAIGCTVVNIGPQDIMQGRQHLILGLLWQIIRIGLFAKTNINNCPAIAAVIHEGETLNDILKLSPEEILMRWFNHHLKAAGSNRRINNFSGDIKDSEAYSVLLHQLVPSKCCPSSDIMKAKDLTKRAECLLFEAEKIGCRHFIGAKDVVAGNQKLNLAFVANLFNNYPALVPKSNEEIEAYDESREEKTFRNWMNSLGVNPFINNLYYDIRDGMVLFQLYDKIKPGVVNWDKVNRPPFKQMGGKMKKIENCNYAVEIGKNLKFSLVGIGGEDIFNGTKTLVTALVWQMMREYTLALLAKLVHSDKPISDSEIIDWVNSKLKKARKTSAISSFKDPSISTSLAVIDLVDAIVPGSVDYNIVNSGQTEMEKQLNAQYAVTMARRIGAAVFALPADLIEIKPKMVLTIFASLQTAALQK
ncbi:Fimbrin [Trichoplax sp. H2]|uniref:Fimbrin n=1 Tax=Trichoplax adhaerens TaxID=10228 RepID=B3S5U7_TRIAD|nr:hypothetical protein TRIADDRAFT_59481 [Trichoplax adhaerens]EDV21962.1 hypothetical protein TRIADDRAFT_59481 [Trichoplax adhaerens]RDD40321.1 Fimbrin [Trichoplax sp. H2]|eukprot:XP_002115599.1 hypothetical protein TRIADDRAFT_59481 [Trichoplax adhaerens]